MAEGLVDLQDRSICLNLKIGEIEIDQNRSIETIMWKSVGDVQWRSGEVRGSNYLKNLLPTSGSPSHPAVRANSLFNHNSGENPKKNAGVEPGKGERGIRWATSSVVLLHLHLQVQESIYLSSVRPDLIHCLMFGLMSKPLHDSHLHHPPCAHWQAQHRALPLERHRGRVEDVTDKTRRGVPHSQDVPGRGSK